MTLQWNDIDAAFAFHSLCRSNRNDHWRLAAHSGVWGQCLRSESKRRESASGPDGRHQYVTRAHLPFSKSDLVLRHLNALCMSFAIIQGESQLVGQFLCWIEPFTSLFFLPSSKQWTYRERSCGTTIVGCCALSFFCLNGLSKSLFAYCASTEYFARTVFSTTRW